MEYPVGRSAVSMTTLAFWLNLTKVTRVSNVPYTKVTRVSNVPYTKVTGASNVPYTKVTGASNVPYTKVTKLRFIRNFWDSCS